MPIGELRRLLDVHLRWEPVRRATAHHRPGLYDIGVAILAAAGDRFPDDAKILYDLACYECRANRHDAALDHLRQALELDPGLRPAAAGEGDFMAVRGHPRFAELVSS
jgi:hypothetical protein